MSASTTACEGHVFLVDDDDDLREDIADLLRYVGYQVLTWTKAESFLEKVPNHVPAVLLTDMRMPGMSGVELHMELRRQKRTMPVIYISGESSVPQSVTAMKLGAADFLIKPFGREELLAAVGAAIEQDRRTALVVSAHARMTEALSRLTPRETQVYQLLLQGFSNSEIVAELKISLPTAKQYKREVMGKLGARQLSELLAMGKDLIDGKP